VITRTAAVLSPPPEERKARSETPCAGRCGSTSSIGSATSTTPYLNWIEQAATDHAEAIGFGGAWAQAQNRAWAVREHRISYRRPLVYGDAVLVTTIPERLSEARG